MPEEHSQDPNNPVTPPVTPPAQAPITPEGENKGFDTASISDDDFNKIFDDPRTFKHPRFSELAAAKKERDALKAAQDKQKEDDLREQKKFEELAELNLQKANEATTKFNNLKIDSAIEREAHKLGVVDSEAVLALLDRTNVKMDDTGTVTGITEALTSLLTAKPYLKGEGSQTMGNPSNPGNPNNSNVKTFRLSQLDDATFFQKNEKEIREAMKAGKIIDDKQ